MLTVRLGEDVLEPTNGSTRHGCTTSDAVVKICTLPLLAGENISAAFVVPTVAACIDLVVHCVRLPDGRRRVGQILSLGRRVENGIIESGMVFDTLDGRLTPSASAMPSPEKFAAAGFSVAALMGDS
nr:CpaF/VirB11 family protein [Arthrobacter wenxiniae]